MKQDNWQPANTIEVDLWYSDWDAQLDREGMQIRRWMRDRNVTSVLDASCGPGTYAVALAQQGFQVTAADGRTRLLEQARVNAHHYNLARKIKFVEAGFLELPQKVGGEGQFDAVLTKGNAVPRLISDEDIAATLANFHQLLRPGGTVMIGMQDFEPFVEDRPRFIPIGVEDDDEEAPQQVKFQVWDWEDGPPLMVKINHFLVTGRGMDYLTYKREERCRAITAVEMQVGLLEAGFEKIEIIRDRLEVVMIATKPH